ncbi:hypothetical protein [Sphingobacterium daejeonense]|uniref:hypothetical protein n=1 Tax=Sphingobacterium daejeonense TaxID=371142 RepID=UPI003D321DEB
MVALSTEDEDFNFDHGYTRGTIQYALSLKDPYSTNSTSDGKSDSNFLKSDNNAKGSARLAGTPSTKPVLKKFYIYWY